MLKTRVVTAVLMLAAFLPSLFLLPQRYWALLSALIAGVAAWEWGALNRLGQRGRILYGALVTALCGGTALVFPAVIGGELPVAPGAKTVLLAYGLTAVFWGVVVPLWLRRKWQLAGSLIGALAGLVVIIPAWLALVQLRIPGPAALLAILGAVWIADIAAYFSGKAFGRHKLAPSISPGKTWEGAVGAGLAVLAYGSAMRQVFGIDGIPLAVWLPGLLVVTAVSVVGDLFESLLKRQAGLKDSSNILPGHGGVLDRIDSLTSTLPAVALLWLLFSPNPA